MIGKSRKQPIGAYAYDKLADDGSTLRCTVTVYPLEVHYLDKDWPEASERARQWFDQADAADLVDEPDLRTILRHYQPPK
ncbi:hypothetical protein Sa4125_32050 [Aureimonas sp. SA4125]|nr:hypothetical protein Sa4125_32050 [Aureimonas sp. SA4125]